MSTRSTIAIKTNNGVDIIYCHFDGYLQHHLPILRKHYNTTESVKELIALGNLSSLDESAHCPKGHTFNNPVEGYCVAYGRDRDESGQEAKHYATWADALEEQKEEYNYIFTENGWLCDRIDPTEV